MDVDLSLLYVRKQQHAAFKKKKTPSQELRTTYATRKRAAMTVTQIGEAAAAATCSHNRRNFQGPQAYERIVATCVSLIGTGKKLLRFLFKYFQMIFDIYRSIFMLTVGQIKWENEKRSGNERQMTLLYVYWYSCVPRTCYVSAKNFIRSKMACMKFETAAVSIRYSQL